MRAVSIGAVTRCSGPASGELRGGQALRVLHRGAIVEQQPRARPFPKALLMAMILPELPLFVSVGYDRVHEYLHVITVHWLDLRKWEDPWTRRLKPPKLRRQGRRNKP